MIYDMWDCRVAYCVYDDNSSRECWKTKNVCDVVINSRLAEQSEGNIMRIGIDLDEAALPVGAKQICAHALLNKDVLTFEEADRTAAERIQCTCAELGTDPAALLSELNVR